MVECTVEVLSFDIPELENHSIIFDLFTPWVNRHRILSGHGHMSRILPTWNEDDFFEFLDGRPTSCPIIIEARYSKALFDEVKRHSAGMEKLCGMAKIDIFQSILDMDEDQIVQDVVFRDQRSYAEVGTARICIHITFWPDLKEKITLGLRPISPGLRALQSAMTPRAPPASPTMSPTRRSKAGFFRFDVDATDDGSTVKSTLFQESPDSPLDFEKTQDPQTVVTERFLEIQKSGDWSPQTA